MATQTPYLSLVLMQTGENVGTWGIPLNQNFQTIDTIAGEIINARGSNSNISERFSVIDTELGAARGTFSNLNDRLNYLINPDGTSRIENYARATSSTFGVVRLSKPSSDPNTPVVVENTDPRLLTQLEKEALTGGSVTHIHKHYLNDIADISATAQEVNQALQGVTSNVTAANLSILTGGGIVPKSLMTIPNAAYNYTGIVSLSSSPQDSANPIAVGTNDNRMLTQTQKDELTSSNNTSLHKHKLADGASDLTVTAVELNRLSGASTRVNASNLDILTGGENTTLHHHDTRYYPRSDVDNAIQVAEQRVTQALANHSQDDASHEGKNLRLGNMTAKSVAVTEQAGFVEVKAHANDAATAQKLRVKDSSGLVVAAIDAEGTITAKKLVVDVQEVRQVQTTQQKAVVTSNLEVNGNAVIGDDENTDTFIAKVVTAEFKGAMSVAGALTAETVNGVKPQETKTELEAVKAEVVAARGTESTVLENINAKNVATNARIDTLINAKNNPTKVTITQAIAEDDGTDITVQQLETLSDGSSADALHTHAKYDTIFDAVKTSAIYGDFNGLPERLEALEQKLNAHNTEIVNARNSESSVDARLDSIDNTNTTQSGLIAALQNSVGTLNTNQSGHATRIAAAEGKIATAQSDIAAMKAVDVTVNSQIQSLTNNQQSAAGVQASLVTRMGQVEAKNTEQDTVLQGKVSAANVANTSVVRKQIISDVSINQSSITQTATMFTDIGVQVAVYDQSNGRLLSPHYFDIYNVTMNAGVARVGLRLRSSFGSGTGFNFGDVPIQTSTVRLVVMG